MHVARYIVRVEVDSTTGHYTAHALAQYVDSKGGEGVNRTVHRAGPYPSLEHAVNEAVRPFRSQEPGTWEKGHAPEDQPAG